MKAENIMTQRVKACHPNDSLNAAAQIMWDYDCGCVPVIDDQARVVGILTDRDICMAAYTQGKALRSIPVSAAMSRPVYGCRPDDTVQQVESLMQKYQIHRVPVVDRNGQLLGIVSLNDLAREAARERNRSKKELTTDEVATTLAAICEPHVKRKEETSSVS